MRNSYIKFYLKLLIGYQFLNNHTSLEKICLTIIRYVQKFSVQFLLKTREYFTVEVHFY